MGYQVDIDAMPDLCRRPLSLQQFHGEGRKISDLQSCQVAYLSLFEVDLEYTYALEERLLHEDETGDFSQLLTTAISSEHRTILFPKTLLTLPSISRHVFPFSQPSEGSDRSASALASSF